MAAFLTKICTEASITGVPARDDQIYRREKQSVAALIRCCLANHLNEYHAIRNTQYVRLACNPSPRYDSNIILSVTPLF